MSAALVEACKPTEKIRDSNIHRKHSPRYADVPVSTNRWNKAEDRGCQRETDRRQRKKSKETEEDLVNTESFLGHLEAAHAKKRGDREMNV